MFYYLPLAYRFQKFKIQKLGTGDWKDERVGKQGEKCPMPDAPLLKKWLNVLASEVVTDED